ncbi:hypothetical protein BGY98DRAFT_1011120 [Russula aff. rugulosa BPL654]|nr:hypothetical protein BGY98DRAFT_1011120 [Russula aff. rugulosa BPL654]
MRLLLPLAVVSRAEYFVLLLRCVAEATSTTPNAMSVISQHRRDKVRVRQRHRTPCLVIRLLTPVLAKPHLTPNLKTHA